MIKQLDKFIRNFIWSGDILKRKVVIVKWHTLCSPKDEGGLGLRSLRSINNAAMLKLAWELEASDKVWARLIKARFVRFKNPIDHYVKSSIWPGIKPHLQIVNLNGTWRIGNGMSINFWTDKWLDAALVDTLHIPAHLHQLLRSKVSDFL